MKKIKEEKGSMAVYVIVTLVSFCLILTGIYISTSSVRKAQIKTEIKIKEVYENINLNETKSVEMVEAEDGIIVPVPKGFVASTISGEKKVSTGFVIKQGNDGSVTEGVNEFVWIPVENSKELYKNGVAQLTGVNISTDIYSNLRVRQQDAGTYVLSTPGNASGIKEPDILSSYDVDAQYYKNVLGFENVEEMAKFIVSEYKSVIDSIEKYKGFYLGRYELSGTVDKPMEVKGGVPLQKNWFELYKASKNFINNNYVGSNMLFGCQYDEVCAWLEKSGYDVNSNSSSWGNFSGSPINTGTNIQYKANNIYDLAGNYWESTQEVIRNNNRVRRGGVYVASGSAYPASSRLDLYPDYVYVDASTRVALYIK